MEEDRAIAPPSPPSLGARIGRYELLASLGRGGMASISLARLAAPTADRRLVALKLIHAHLAGDPEVVRMFVDEATLTSRIRHPNVCQVVDFGNADGTWYIAMEHLEGTSLSTLLRASAKQIERGSASRREVAAAVCRVVLDAARGLHAAHEALDEQGRPLHIVHRDVSPDNLFVTFDGVTKVVDFGIAAGLGRLQHTSTGVTKGKPSYLPPEMLDDGLVDRRADLWSLGVVLWEGITLQRLFRYEVPSQTVAAVLRRPVAPPSSVCDVVGARVDAIVMRALERDLGRRWPTARALGDALEAACRAEGLLASSEEVSAWVAGALPGLRDVMRAELGRALEVEDPTTAEILLPEAAWGRGDEEGEATDPLAPSTSHVAVGGANPEGGAAEARGRRPLFWAAVACAMACVGIVSYWLSGAPSRRDGQGGPATPVAASWSPDAASAAGRSRDASAARGEGEARDGVGSAGLAPDAGVSPALDPDAGVAPEGAADAAAGEAAEGGAGAAGAPGDALSPGGRPGTAAPPAVPAYGEVRVATPGGWAEVYHRGRRLAPHTPATVRLPVGRQVLELRFAGRRPGRRAVVQVRDGRAVPLVVRAPGE